MRHERRAPSRGVLFTLALMLFGCGPDDDHEGRLSAEAPITAPISGSAACIVRLDVDDGRVRRGVGMQYVGPRHAPGLRFHTAGRSLVVSTEDGDLQPGRDSRVDYGQPSYRRGAMYHAGPGPSRRPAPAALAEWGAASRALCFGDIPSPVDCARLPRSIWITERLAPCDQPVRLRGSIVGGRFVLRDTTAGSLQRAGTFMGGLTCCSLAVVSLFIGALILGATASIRGLKRIFRRRGSAPPRSRD